MPKLLAPPRNGDAEAVFGARGFASHAAYSFWYVIGNRGVSFAANLLFHYRARSRAEGKRLTALDGLRVLRALLRCCVD